MDNTLIKVTLKGIEGVSKAHSVVSLYSHRQPFKNNYYYYIVQTMQENINIRGNLKYVVPNYVKNR